jgi:hypothetical protein
MNHNNSYISLLVFAVAATMSYDLDLIARIPLGEFLAFVSVPFLLSGIRLRQFSDRIKPIFWIFGLWVLGIAISDFVNGSTMVSFLKGFAKPVWCFFWMLFFLGILIKSPISLFWYPAGTVVASLQNYYLPQAWTLEAMGNEGSYEATAYGVVPILASLCVFLAVLIYRKSRLLASGIFLFYAIVLLWVGAPRSSAAIALLLAMAIGYMAWRNHFTSIGRSRVLTIKAVVLYGVGAFLASMLLFELYVFAASNHMLGDYQYQKYVVQSGTIFGNSILGLILGGRAQVFGGILAILDNPFLGYGSWSGIGLSNYFYDAVAYVGTDARELSALVNSMRMPGPGHSILFQGWMENGLLAAIAFLTIAWIGVKQLLLLVQNEHWLTPWFLNIGIGFGWSFLFSPFGVGARVVIGLYLALYLTRTLEHNTRTTHHRTI